MIKTHLWNISFSDLHACIHMNHKGWILNFPELIWGRASPGTRTRMSSAHQRVDSWALRTWRTSLVQFPAPGIHSSYSQQWQSSLWARHGGGTYGLGKGGHTTGSGLYKFFLFSFDLEILCLEHGGISVLVCLVWLLGVGGVIVLWQLGWETRKSGLRSLTESPLLHELCWGASYKEDQYSQWSLHGTGLLTSC